MTSIWKAIRSTKKADKISNFKHEKLFEELSNDGSIFYCKYLGYMPVESPSGASTNAKAIRQMMSMKSRLKCNKSISLSIQPNQIIIEELDNNNDNDNNNVCQPIIISLNRISYCFVDSTYERIIAFVATNDNNCHECHAFMTDKTKIAKSIALTISKAFINAYERWIQQKILISSSSSSTNNSTTQCKTTEYTTMDTTTTTTTNQLIIVVKHLVQI
ncbi:Low density lipoprotein receptor adapter protein 1 [Dermatophagoides pteronyssinus]|uniref:Low density lipoprotein receptor adapter protein 1 n=1 Tax=Dermatophagoides pteronyssinus TaxID=6956 RepID=A0ABQ8IV10_DERPT|nr:Low density lipoprotein receptor adapter protein 1 [Dermatophagoides pteronyssinus]